MSERNPNVVPPTDDEIRAFIARFGSNVADAVCRVARVAEVAIAYEYRVTIDPDDVLTDEQWSRVVPHLEDYDEFIDEVAGEAVYDWRAEMFAHGGAVCPNGRPLVRLERFTIS